MASKPKASPKKKPAKKKLSANIGGRPSKYSEAWAVKMALVMARAGMIDKGMAVAMGVAESTFHKWKLDHPEFAAALTKGKEDENILLEHALFREAKGYWVTEITTYKDTDGEVTNSMESQKWVRGNATSQIFALKNRLPEIYRDRQEVLLDFDNDPLKVFGEGLMKFRLAEDDKNRITD